VSRPKKFGDVVASPEEVSEAKVWIEENAGALKGLSIRAGSTDKESRKTKRIEQSLATMPDQVPVEEEDNAIIAGSDLYEIDGEVQTCINCDVRLTVEDVKQDLKRCKKNEWDEPEEGFVCQKADCKKYRMSVSGYEAEEKREADERILVNDGKRQLEDGGVRGDEPLRDFFFATKHELGEVSTRREPGEVGVPSREERTDQEIHRDTRSSAIILLPRCRKHGTPGCKPCKINEELAQHYKDHSEERTHNGLPKVKPKAWVAEAACPRQLPLEKEVERILQQKRIAKLAKRPPKPSHELRREKEHAWVKRTYDKYSLRRLHGYTRRQLAALFDSPHFNPKRARVFTPGQVAFYQDYALGKTSTEVFEARIADGFYGRAGFEHPDYLKRLEDRLVNHAWYVGLLEITPVAVPGAENDDDPYAPNTETEDKVIGRGGSNLSIIGSKYKSTPGKTFKTYGLSSFEQGVITRRVSGGGGSGGSSDRVADYDDTAEEGD
jgi:hypothetical protein